MPEPPEEDPSQIWTERLRLTPLRPEDAQEMFEVMRDPVLGAFTGEPPPASPDALRDRYVAWQAGSSDGREVWCNWIARRGEDGRAVGHLAATVSGSTAWLAWIVDAGLQRQGYATEAARAVGTWLRSALDVTVLAASIPAGHEASEGVARNLGLSLTDEIMDGERVWRGPAV